MKNASIQSDYFDHPVFNPFELVIETPSMKSLHEQIHQWLWTGATGALVIGKKRTGKSTAMIELGNQLYTRNNKSVPVHRFTVKKRDKPTIRSLFRNMCISADIPITKYSDADEMSDSFMHYLLDKVHDYQTNRVVLIVDEMQRLKSYQFDAFAELYDQLRDPFGISLMVIFVANDPECNKLIKIMQDESHQHIHGRFFTLRTDFLGLTSEKNVKSCLRQYDTLRFPLDMGPTYTEYFLAKDFKNGFRLASLSRPIWSVFREYKKNYKLKSWGMQYFITATNTILTDFLPHYGIDSFSEEMVHEAIKVSGLVPSLVQSVSK